MSQFWYSQETIKSLSEEVVSQVDPLSARVGCIACPSLYCHLRDLIPNSILFEFDDRFDVFGEKFVHYDYSFPLHLDSILKESFDFLVVDPPFLSPECLQKTCQTVNFLLAPGGKILFCTGKVMKTLLAETLDCQETSFHPSHSNGLSNEFGSFANYKSKLF